MYGHWETGKAGCGRGRPEPENLPFWTEVHSGHERWPVCRMRPHRRKERMQAERRSGALGKHQDAAFFRYPAQTGGKEKKYDKQTEKTGAPDGVRRAFVRRVARGGRDAHHGGLFAPVHVRFVGRARAALPACGILFHQADGRARPPRDHAGRHGGRVYLCDLVAQDPVRDRFVLAHDRHRPGRDPVRAERGVHPGRDRAAVSGHPAGARRPDHAGRKRVFHGGRRAVRVLRHLQAVPAAAGEQNGIGFPRRSAGATCSPTA